VGGRLEPLGINSSKGCEPSNVVRGNLICTFNGLMASTSQRWTVARDRIIVESFCPVMTG
jgi:hypothetical protein